MAVHTQVGQEVSVALEKLLSTMLSMIADSSSSGDLAMHPQLSRTAARSIIAPPRPQPNAYPIYPGHCDTAAPCPHVG